MFAILILLMQSFAVMATTDDTCLNHPMGVCQAHLLQVSLSALGAFPNLDQLDHLCPPLSSYMNCLHRYEERCGWTDEGMFSSSEEFAHARSLIYEMCDTRSHLRQTYAENINCLTQVNHKIPFCTFEGRSKYIDYDVYQKRLLKERDDLYRGNNALCVSKAYKMGCMAAHVKQSCSYEALSVVLEIFRKSHSLKRFCKEDDILDLQTNFLDFLPNTENKRVFDMVFRNA